RTSSLSRLAARAAASASGPTRAAWISLGVIAAIGIWLTRYDLLLKNNSDAASIKRGAQYLDVTGLFSSLNYITVTAVVALGFTFAIAVLLGALHRRDGRDWRRRFARAGRIAILLVAFDFAFKCAVVVRNWIGVKPNEPVI